MKSFSLKTKESLCKTVDGKSCCIEAEIMGFLMFAGRLSEGSIKVSSESREILKRIAVLIKRSCQAAVRVEEGKNNYFCVLPHKKLIDMVLMYETSEKSILELFAKDDCCKSAFLRGAFLGGGILVDPKKNYNLEFITSSINVHDDFKNFLNEMGLEFKSTKRKNNFILYSKQSDIICDVLTYIGAFAAQMEILNVKIEREMRNDWNRVANSENANFDKVITAAIRQIRAIEKIENTIGLDSLPDELTEIARLRIKNKDLSLEALGSKLTPKLTKSGVNHRIKKILDIAENKL
ncbi:MAG: DNA-binding protein WhiA [Clostridia bacterium]|nr:DNA-binding protein WhiA [Clostridia bacterium]